MICNRYQLFNQGWYFLLKKEIGFVAKNICDGLDLLDVLMTVRRLNDGKKGVNTIDTLGGNQELLMVNDSGMYNLVLK